MHLFWGALHDLFSLIEPHRDHGASRNKGREWVMLCKSREGRSDGGVGGISEHLFGWSNIMGTTGSRGGKGTPRDVATSATFIRQAPGKALATIASPSTLFLSQDNTNT